MHTHPNSIYDTYDTSKSGRALSAGTSLAGTVGALRAEDNFGTTSAIVTILRRASSVFARIFDGLAEQRDRQAKQIVAYYGPDRSRGSFEKNQNLDH